MAPTGLTRLRNASQGPLLRWEAGLADREGRGGIFSPHRKFRYRTRSLEGSTAGLRRHARFLSFVVHLPQGNRDVSTQSQGLTGSLCHRTGRAAARASGLRFSVADEP